MQGQSTNQASEAESVSGLNVPNEQSVEPSLWVAIKKETRTWLIGLMVALLSVFSAQIVESVQTSINTVEARSDYQKGLLIEVSNYIYAAEVNVVYLQQGIIDGPSLRNILDTYNTSITELRKKEYVYLAWLKRYWQPDSVVHFKQFMATVRQYDQALHRLNPAVVKLLAGDNQMLLAQQQQILVLAELQLTLQTKGETLLSSVLQ